MSLLSNNPQSFPRRIRFLLFLIISLLSNPLFVFSIQAKELNVLEGLADDSKVKIVHLPSLINELSAVKPLDQPIFGLNDLGLFSHSISSETVF
jgi:hypothetical protein